MPPTVVSLFAGAGGLDLGLEQAGFETITATDIDPDCCATLRQNRDAACTLPSGRSFLKSAHVVEADVAELGAEDLADAEIDLLAGGPPCQPFSSAGKQYGLDDPRGRLWEHFLRLADSLNPRMILLENVRGLVTAKGPDGKPGGAITLVRDAFEELGYGTRFTLINAADHGVPQRRVRLFMIASRVSPLPEFPTTTHEKADRNEPTLLDRAPWVPLSSVLLPEEALEDEEIVRPTEAVARQLETLEPGDGIKVGGVVEANRPGGHWGYRQDGFIADPTIPSRTVRAASTPDWLRLEDGSHRRLTWLECARLQGFPDDWHWAGTVTSRFRQIGNAVAVPVARAIGEQLCNGLQAAEDRRPESAPWPRRFTKAAAYTAMEQRVNGAARLAGVRAGT